MRERQLAVRAFVVMSPDPELAGPGERCWRHEDCRSDVCVDELACAALCDDSGDCDPGEACVLTYVDPDLPGWAWGRCDAWDGSRVPCPGPVGSCADIPEAAPDELCLPNPLTAGPAEWLCGAPRGDGALGDLCEIGDDCASALCATTFLEAPAGCVSGCVDDADCEAPQRCFEEWLFRREGIAEPSLGKICL